VRLDLGGDFALAVPGGDRGRLIGLPTGASLPGLVAHGASRLSVVLPGRTLPDRLMPKCSQPLVA